MTISPIMSHALWPEILPLLRAQPYDRDGGHRHPRHRIEVAAPPLLRHRLLNLEVACVAGCGRIIHPIRQRRGRRWTGRLYLSVSCDWGHRENLRCSRGRAAHDEYERIVAAIAGYVRPASPSLFD